MKIYDLDGNQIYLFQLDSDPNIVVGVDETGQISFAVYLDQTTTNDLTNLQARIWTVQFEPLKPPNPADADEAISLGFTGRLHARFYGQGLERQLLEW